MADQARTEPTLDHLVESTAVDVVFDIEPNRDPGSGRAWPARALTLVGVGVGASILVAVLVTRSGTTPPVAAPDRTAIAVSTTAGSPTIAVAVSTSTGASLTTASSATVPVVIDTKSLTNTADATTTPTIADVTTTQVATSESETSPLTTTSVTAAAVPNGTFLATVVSVSGGSVTWQVVCGLAANGGDMPLGRLVLPLDAFNVTIDAGGDGTSRPSTVSVHTWAQTTVGRWWVTVTDARVTTVTAASLAPLRCG